MRTALLALFCCLTCHAVEVEAPAPPQMAVAIVQLNKMTGDMDYDKVRLLNLDKDSLEAIKKINAEMAKLKKEIIEATDEVKLMDLQKQMEFNNKKLALLRDRNSNREVNVQKLAQDYVVRKFSRRYSMILQDASSLDNRAIYKNVAITDITEEAAAGFRAEISERIGEK